jgi:WD40 repeat protein
VHVWNLRTGECTHTLKGYTSYVSDVTFDGKTIASGSDDGTVRIWSAPYNTAVCERVIGGHIVWTDSARLCTAPNEHIVVSSHMYRAHVHDTRTGDLLCAPIECFDGKLS